jgi:hypothetical protein
MRPQWRDEKRRRLLAVAAGGGRCLQLTSVGSAARAFFYLTNNEYGDKSREQADQILDSFEGDLYYMVIREGGQFFRYSSDSRKIEGDYLTRHDFYDPEDAVRGLYLRPYGNFATRRQIVTAIVSQARLLYGKIKNSDRDLMQFVPWKRSDFDYGRPARLWWSPVGGR